MKCLDAFVQVIKEKVVAMTSTVNDVRRGLKTFACRLQQHDYGLDSFMSAADTSSSYYESIISDKAKAGRSVDAVVEDTTDMRSTQDFLTPNLITEIGKDTPAPNLCHEDDDSISIDSNDDSPEPPNVVEEVKSILKKNRMLRGEHKDGLTFVHGGDTMTSYHCNRLFPIIAKSLKEVRYQDIIPTPHSIEDQVTLYLLENSDVFHRRAYVVCATNSYEFHLDGISHAVNAGTVFHVLCELFDICINVYSIDHLPLNYESGRARKQRPVINLVMLNRHPTEPFFVQATKGVECPESEVINLISSQVSSRSTQDDMAKHANWDSEALKKVLGKGYSLEDVLADFTPCPSFISLLSDKTFPTQWNEAYNALTKNLKNVSNHLMKETIFRSPPYHLSYEHLLNLTQKGSLGWIKAEVIDYYCSILGNRFYGDIVILPTTFFTNLLKDPCSNGTTLRSVNYKKLDVANYSHFNVIGYTRRVDLFKSKLVFSVINNANYHWTLIVAKMESKEIWYYDSANHGKVKKRNHFNQWGIAFEKYLKDEYRLKNGEWPKYEWTRHIFQKGKQTDGYNCGIYALLYMECLLNDINPDDVPNDWLVRFRKILLLNIVTSRCLYNV